MLKMLILTLFFLQTACSGTKSTVKDSGLTVDGTVPSALDAGLDGALPAPDGQIANADAQMGSKTALVGALSVGVGVFLACAVHQDGRVLCWTPESPKATALPGISTASLVAVGEAHACAIEKTRLSCWGRGSDGQLAPMSNNRDARDASVPVAITGATSLSAGYGHTCALLDGGQVQCWGDLSSRFEQVAFSIDSIGSRVCAATNQGRVVCWTDQDPDPRAVPSGVGAELALGNEHLCLRNAAKVRCFGGNTVGQLGVADRQAASNELLAPTDVAQITAGDGFTCARRTNGEVWCWGVSYGFAPVRVTLAPAAHISAGASRACAALQDTTVACWEAGQAPTIVEIR